MMDVDVVHGCGYDGCGYGVWVWHSWVCGWSKKEGGGIFWNLSYLSFVIPVNKMNLKSLPLLNHIPYKSKELYLLHQQFKKVHLSISLYNLFQNEISTYIFLLYHQL